MRFWKWTLGIIILVSMLVGAAAWYVSRKWRPILDQQLKALVLNASDSLYSINYSNLRVNLVTGNASLSNLSITPDTAVYARLDRQKKAPDNVYTLKVKKLEIHSLHPKTLYRQRKLIINKITIGQPDLYISKKLQPYNRIHRDTASTKTIYQSISSIVNEVRIKEIRLNNTNFLLVNRSDEKPRRTSLKGLNIAVNDVLVDSLSHKDKSRFYNTRNIDFELKNYRIATPDSLYFLTFNKVLFSTEKSRLQLSNLTYTARYSTDAFYKKVKQSKEKFDVNIEKVTLNNIDIEKLRKDRRLYSSKVVIANGKIDIYNTNQYPKVKRDRTGKFPHQQLQKLAFDLNFPHVVLQNLTIAYHEHNQQTRSTGRLVFSKMRGNLYNVSNDALVLKKQPLARASVTTSFMGRAPLSVLFTFNMVDKKGAFSYAGTLGAMDGRAVNAIVRPLALAEVKSLSVKKLQFNMHGNEDYTKGLVKFWYDDLKINLLKKDQETGSLRKRGLASSVANMYVLQQSNPRYSRNDTVFTVGKAYFKRSYEMSFFNLMWKGLLEGLKQSVGFSTQKEEKIKEINATVTRIFNNVRQDVQMLKERRKEKRRERIKRRELRKKKTELQTD